MSKPGLTESQFYMWRTLFAVAHADDVVTDEELRFMVEAMEDIPFSDDQRAILNDDVKHAQDIEEMFNGITDVHDQARFFQYVRELVHIDGDYGKDEQDIVLKLQKTHLKNPHFSDLIGKIDLELEDDMPPPRAEVPAQKPRSFREKVFSFRERFKKEI